MPRLLYVALLLALAAPLHAQPAADRHSEVRLLSPADGDVVGRLAASGVALDHATPEATARGVAIRAVLSAPELAAARAAGVEVEVLVADVAAHYHATRRGTCAEGRGVSRVEADLCGPMGGYPTLTGVLAHLDTLHARYPHLVSARASIGSSHEGRDVWVVELSDHPGVDEGEPEALYTGLHHAREPGSMMAVLYFMYYLAEQYGTDPDVTALVNGRRLFFVPVLNPDGYAYNEAIEPTGGGMWRKNRRDNGDGTVGVDLNRNYGYLWGYDNTGSSPSTWSETYRGTAPFSEPETRALRDFLEGGRRVTAALNYHTHGDLLLYPWSYAPNAFTPDNARFEALAGAMTALNGYTYGTSPSVLYRTNGDANDWMYGEQTTKPKAFSFTPEVGYWFWPDPVDVYALADENLEANLILAAEATGVVVAAEPGADGAALALAVLGPNPVRGRAALAYTLPAPAAVRLTLHDALGREVAVLAEGAHAAGRHEATADAAGLAPGVYFVRLAAAGAALTRPLTVRR